MLRLTPMSLLNSGDASSTIDLQLQNLTVKGAMKIHHNLPKKKYPQKMRTRLTGWLHWHGAQDRETTAYIMDEIYRLAEAAIELYARALAEVVIEHFTLMLMATMNLMVKKILKKKWRMKMMSLRRFHMATPPTMSSSRDMRRNVGDRKRTSASTTC